MAVIEFILGIAFVVLLCCWPHFFVRKPSDRDRVGTMYAIPLMLVVVGIILIASRSC
jgi:hypothetical protein